jgi:hypothetical protein
LAKSNITNVNLTACISDVGNSPQRFNDFSVDMKNKKYVSAVEELGRGLSALANAITTCGVEDVAIKFTTLATRVKFANVSTSWLGTKVLVGASDLWKDLQRLQGAVESGNSTEVGEKLGTLVEAWTAIDGGCERDLHVCEVIDGLLKVVGATASKVTYCVSALRPVVEDMQEAGKLFKSKNYTNATAKFAAAFIALANATQNNACGLKYIARAIGGTIGIKLSSAVVQASSINVTQIMVGSADVFNEVKSLSEDLVQHNFAGAGVQMGVLLAKLHTSNCKTNMCAVVSGLLSALEVGLTDLDACASDLDVTWTKMEAFSTSLQNRQWGQSLLDLGDVFHDLATDIRACGVGELEVLENVSTALGLDSFANDIGKTVQFMTKGADITEDVQKFIVDIRYGNWSQLGKELGGLTTWVASTTCTSFVCKIMEGIFQAADLVIADLQPCILDLRLAELDFNNGTMLWGQNRHRDAINFWSAGLAHIAKAVSDCGLSTELTYIMQEANVLSLANVVPNGNISSIMVHGYDMWTNMDAAFQSIARQDYRTAGSEFQAAVSNLFNWTTSSLCPTNPTNACYIFNGMMQFINSTLQAEFRQCKVDFQAMESDFKLAFHAFIDNNSTGFSANTAKIAQGVANISKGLEELGAAITDCHLEEFVAILALLAGKLSLAPEITIMEDLLKILIEGIPIEKEIATATEDFATQNWPGVGYNLIKLIETLLLTNSASLKRSAPTKLSTIVV